MESYTYWVFTAPDDILDPTVWHNGQSVVAQSHINAANVRFASVDPGSVAASDVWVAGPNEDGHLKLVRFKVRPTAFEIESST
jgi:hypothetical protein